MAGPGESPPRRTRVALALGSGGARGYAHVGAIQVLEERGYEIVSVGGSSMGALVGGVYATGVLDDYTEWACGLSQRDVLRLLDVSLTSAGAIRADKLLARVRDLLGDVRIEDLRIPYTAVATDLLARKEVWFRRGPLHMAIRASISIPGVFVPVMLNGRLLADGGLMDPVPVAPTSGQGADLMIAISLGGERGMAPAPVQETAESRPVEEWIDRFRRGAANLVDRDVVRALMARFGSGDGFGTGVAGPPTDIVQDDMFDPLPHGLTKLDVMNQALDAIQSVLTRYRLAGYPPDLLIEVRKDACRSIDFHRATEMIEVGRILTARALDEAGYSAVPR